MSDGIPVSPKRKRRWLRALAILIVVGVVGYLWFRPGEWDFRRELPWSTSDIHEWYWSDGFLPDYSYQLKARMTEAQFHRYISKFALTPHTAERQYSDSAVWLRWRHAPGFTGEWWDPSMSLDSTYVWQGGDTWIFAKYERGFLYLASVNH